MLCVLGTPCGGTNYVASALARCGLDVGHERVRVDGTVCGFAFFAMRDGPGPGFKASYKALKWDRVVHLVRHPLDVAETLPGLIKDLPKGPWTVEDWRVGALRYWVEAHEGIPGPLLRIGPWFREDWANAFRGLVPPDPPEGVRRRSKRAEERWPRMSWAEWAARDPGYARRGEALWDYIISS